LSLVTSAPTKFSFRNFAAGPAGIFFADAGQRGFRLEPEYARRDQMHQCMHEQAREQRAQLAGVQAQMAALQSPGMNPDVAARAELDGLKKQLDELASRFQVMERSLVPPQQMSSSLEDMIGTKAGLRLLSLKTLPAAPLLDKKVEPGDKASAKPQDKVENPSAGLYKHGVEIRLEGSYQDLTAYLQRLEQSQMKLLWSSVSLSADNHPKLVLTLTVYTLSLDRAWLIV